MTPLLASISTSSSTMLAVSIMTPVSLTLPRDNSHDIGVGVLPQICMWHRRDDANRKPLMSRRIFHSR